MGREKSAWLASPGRGSQCSAEDRTGLASPIEVRPSLIVEIGPTGAVNIIRPRPSNSICTAH